VRRASPAPEHRLLVSANPSARTNAKFTRVKFVKQLTTHYSLFNAYLSLVKSGADALMT